MTISKENKEFIDSLIDYYISEAAAYEQIAQDYVPEIESVADTAFGIIAGCVYSGFLQAYANQQQTASLEDVKEFNRILKDRAPLIKKSILDSKAEGSQGAEISKKEPKEEDRKPTKKSSNEKKKTPKTK